MKPQDYDTLSLTCLEKVALAICVVSCFFLLLLVVLAALA
jgi:hypothetical protein